MSRLNNTLYSTKLKKTICDDMNNPCYFVIFSLLTETREQISMIYSYIRIYFAFIIQLSGINWQQESKMKDLYYLFII